MPTQYPQVYTTQAQMGAGSTATITDKLGFKATQIRLANYEAVDIYFDFKGNAPSTSSFRIRACTDLGWTKFEAGVVVSEFGAVTTSTSAAAKVLNITAVAPAGM